MKGELMEVIIEQDFREVWRKEVTIDEDPATYYLQIPPGVLKEDYAHCQLRIDVKGGWKP